MQILAFWEFHADFGFHLANLEKKNPVKSHLMDLHLKKPI